MGDEVKYGDREEKSEEYGVLSFAQQVYQDCMKKGIRGPIAQKMREEWKQSHS